jgi:hypothetical protein
VPTENGVLNAFSVQNNNRMGLNYK